MLEKTKLLDNIHELKEIINDLKFQYETNLKEKEKELKEERFKYLVLEERFQILERRLFGRKSEKVSDKDYGQPYLFNEAEDECNDNIEEMQEASETVSVKSYTRKKKRKDVFPSHLPEKEVIHDRGEEEKICPCCGEERPCIGEEATREIDIIPEQVRIIKHIQKKYGPCTCREFEIKELPEVVTAEKPKRILPGIIASAGLLSYIFVNKFMDSMPYYRQEKRFKRLDIDISRTNMCNWQIGSTRKCQRLIELMWKEVRSGPFIQMDETTSQVLKEPGRPAQSKGYMFVTIGYTQEHKPIVLYHYHRTRNKKIVDDILDGFQGYLQTDGLGIYNDTDLIDGIIHVGCGAHIRRKFHEASKLGKSKSGIAHKVLSYYTRISKIEKDLRTNKKLAHDDFEKKRQSLMKPILADLHNYLKIKQPEIPPKSKLGEAVNYALKEWDHWIRFLDKWYITPDNNYTERKVKSYVIGRKNWLFSDTLRGAYSSSAMYSLIQSAEENGLNSYWYLRYIFTKLPYAETEQELYNLLPMYVSKEYLNEFMLNEL